MVRTQAAENGLFCDLAIDCEKTKAMEIWPELHPPILIMQQNMDYVERFPYLGSYMSSDGDSEPDVRARIGKDASIFQRLRPVYIHYHQLECNVGAHPLRSPQQCMRVRLGRERP